MRAMRWAAVLLGCCVSIASAGEPTPAELRGDWVPEKASCGSPLRFRVGTDTFELQNGADKQSYADIAWPSGYFGPDYQGIAMVAIPEFEGAQPFTVFFNDGEKKGTAKLQILVGEESPNNATYNALVRTGKKLNARFPLDSLVLKKCGADAQAKVRDVHGDYVYQGRGIAQVTQKGEDVHILFTWTPNGVGPHYEARGKIAGDTITGQWYSHYAKKGWFRFVGTVGADGSIDLSQCDDPIGANVRKTVLQKKS